jgi:diamine N-acetyltransferase
MSQAPPYVDRYDPGTFGIKDVDAGLRGLPPGEPERLGPLFAAMEPWTRYQYRPEAITTYLSGIERGAPRLAIMAGNEIAGAVCIRLNWLRGPYLQFIAVLPPFQKMGLGAAMLDWLAQEAKHNGEKNVWVCASDFNLGAIRFYERHGFVRTAVLDGLINADIAEVLMRKRL